MSCNKGKIRIIICKFKCRNFNNRVLRRIIGRYGFYTSSFLHGFWIFIFYSLFWLSRRWTNHYALIGSRNGSMQILSPIHVYSTRFSLAVSLIRNQLRTIFWKKGLINCLFSTAKSSSLRGFLAFILRPHLFHIVLLSISSSNIAIDLINELRRKLLLLLIRSDYHHRWSCGLRVFLRINYPTSWLLPWLLYLVKGGPYCMGVVTVCVVGL